MIKYILKYLLFYIFLLFPVFLSSQAGAQSCDVEYQLIFNLTAPEYGSYNVWSAVYGAPDTNERFVSGVAVHENETVVAGERARKKAGSEKKLILAAFDRRGRTVWEQEYEIRGLHDVFKILKTAQGYSVFANIGEKEKKSIWIGFFNEKGALLTKKVVSNVEGGLTGRDVVMSGRKDGFFLAASLEEGRGEVQENGILYQLSSKGGVLSHKAYMSGVKNTIMALEALEGGEYLAVGYMYGEDGRKAGWILRLNEEGNILWQRAYPRGLEAGLSVGRPFLSNFYVVAGQALPTDEGASAAWLMLVDSSNGNVGWQRYYRGEPSYTSRDLLVSKDGQISFLIDGEYRSGMPEKQVLDEEGKGHDYVRLLTINPRGSLMESDEYFNAEGADAWQLVGGVVGERIMVGATDMVHHLEGEGKNPQVMVQRSQDGWIAVAPPLGPYIDPCARPFSMPK